MTVHQPRPGADPPVFMTMRYSPVLFDRMADSLRQVAEAQFALTQALLRSQFAFMEAMLQGMALPSRLRETQRPHETQRPGEIGHPHETRRDHPRA